MPFDSSWQAEFLDQRLITNFLAPDKPPGPGHHIFVDSLATDPNPLNADSTLLFKELGNRINPATGRPFYDLGNNSDNMISLLGSQGGASNVNGALVHANDHDKYSAFIKNKVAPAVVETYIAARQAGKTHLEALDASGRVAIGYSNSIKMLLLGAYGQGNLIGTNGAVAVTGDVRFTGPGDTTVFANENALDTFLRGQDAYKVGAVQPAVARINQNEEL